MPFPSSSLYPNLRSSNPPLHHRHHRRHRHYHHYHHHHLNHHLPRDHLHGHRAPDEDPPPYEGALNTFLNRMYRRVSTRLPSDIEHQYDKQDRLFKSAQPFITDSQERNENHPLKLMVRLPIYYS